jgi:squalene synthase HpnC
VVTTRDAYAFCERLAREHYENFPVASRLLPAPMRPHIAAIYAFARTADDFADEPGRDPAERLRLLAMFRDRLLSSATSGPPPGDHIFIALKDTIDRCSLPVPLLADLLSAFEQDVRVHRYERWSDVDDYCRRSANPVGRLVLRVANVHDDSADRASDAVCTALQLANFWQDFGRDWRAGRLYVPAEALRRQGATENDLDRPEMTKAWRATIRACVERTRRLFEDGRAVSDFVDGRLRLELRATWLGGVRVLEKIEALGYDTLHRRPRLGVVDAALITTRMAAWNLRRSSFGI